MIGCLASIFEYCQTHRLMFVTSANICHLVQLTVLRSNIRECTPLNLFFRWLHCPRFHNRGATESSLFVSTSPGSSFGDHGFPLSSWLVSSRLGS